MDIVVKQCIKVPFGQICSIWVCAKWVPILWMLSEKSKHFDEKCNPNQSKPNQSEPNQSKPNQSKPNQTKPNQSNQNFLKSPWAAWSYFWSLSYFSPNIILYCVHENYGECRKLGKYWEACVNRTRVWLNTPKRQSPKKSGNEKKTNRFPLSHLKYLLKANVKLNRCVCVCVWSGVLWLTAVLFSKKYPTFVLSTKSVLLALLFSHVKRDLYCQLCLSVMCDAEWPPPSLWAFMPGSGLECIMHFDWLKGFDSSHLAIFGPGKQYKYHLCAGSWGGNISFGLLRDHPLPSPVSDLENFGSWGAPPVSD